MSQSIQANEQAFQSIYLDLKADPDEVIVFHEPIFEDQMTAVLVLKTLRLENSPGMVIAAPRNILRHFLEVIKEADKDGEIGALKADLILKKLSEVADELSASILYKQNWIEDASSIDQSETKVRNVKKEQNLKNKKDAFFDPVTKRGIVQKGPHYFDPSLPTIDDVEKLVKQRNKEIEADNKIKKIYSPSYTVYPQHVTEEGKQAWKEIIRKYSKDIYNKKQPSDRWQLANYLYEEYCNLLGIPAYKSDTIYDTNKIVGEIKKSFDNAIEQVSSIYHEMSKKGLFNKKSKSVNRRKVHDVKITDSHFTIIIRSTLDLSGLGNSKQITEHLSKKYKFATYKSTRFRSAFKKVNDRTTVTFSENANQISHIDIYYQYDLPRKEAELLYGENISDRNIRLALINLTERWLKTNRMKLIRNNKNESGNKTHYANQQS